MKATKVQLFERKIKGWRLDRYEFAEAYAEQENKEL
jgi:hypothetical protein